MQFSPRVPKNMKHYVCQYCGKDIIEKKGTEIRKFCNNKCQGLLKSKNSYEYFLTSPPEFQHSLFKVQPVKKHILEEQGWKCAICKCKQIHNWKPLSFILDHIDWDACNNTRANFRLVCPNCDSQLDTFKSRNKWKCTRKYTPSITRNNNI